MKVLFTVGIQEIEIQVFTTYFVFLCEDWRGICSISDKILVMQRGAKTAFVVNVKQKYVTLNLVPQDTCKLERVTFIFDTICLCIANQTLSLL